jgi:hypothetical protein
MVAMYLADEAINGHPVPDEVCLLIIVTIVVVVVVVVKAEDTHC